jgi:hypothetical protein
LAVAVVTALPSMGTVASLEHQQNDGSALTIEIDAHCTLQRVDQRSTVASRLGGWVLGRCGSSRPLRRQEVGTLCWGRMRKRGSRGWRVVMAQKSRRHFVSLTTVCATITPTPACRCTSRHSPPSVACGAHARASSTCVQHYLLSMFCGVRDELAPADCQN